MSPLSAGGERELGPHTSGVRSKLSGVRSELSGVRSKLSGVRSKLSGVRSELSGVRSELSGVRSELKISREVGYFTLVRYLERTPCWLLVQHGHAFGVYFYPFFCLHGVLLLLYKCCTWGIPLGTADLYQCIQICRL